MLFLDDFLEMLEELPTEIRERTAEMRQIDQQVHNSWEKNQMAVTEFFSVTGPLMTEDEKRERLRQLQHEFKRIRALSEEKITIAERLQELLLKYVQHLEKEQLHFKLELEADNPGVTEQIEHRLKEYQEVVIALRKDRKRKHTSNGNATSNGTSNGVTAEKTARLGECYSPSTSNAGKLDFSSLLDDDSIYQPMTPTSSGRGRKPVDETKRRGSSSLRCSLSMPSAMNGAAVSPAPSEKSWSSVLHFEDSPSSTLLVPPSPQLSGPLTLAPTPQSTPTMPAFVGSESRHGRPRKLTTRVQEMFKECVQRQRDRHHHHSPAVSSPVPPVQPAEGTEEEEEGDSDDARRVWCICNDKSYGDMILCDNKACPYQWFHYPCVNITAPPKGRWFCQHCLAIQERMLREGSGCNTFETISGAGMIATLPPQAPASAYLTPQSGPLI